ncbi:MAG: hypothetical protein ABSG32_24565 [Terriglobia bacterium]|jgi:hypothetical protein
MDKVLELLGRLFPLLPYYPRWIRALAGLTLAIVLILIFLLAVWYSNAAHAREWKTEVSPRVEEEAAAAQQVFSQLGGALSALHTSTIQLRYDLLAYTKTLPDLRQYLQKNPKFLEKDLTETLKQDSERFLEDLGRLRDALKAVQMNGVTQNCWLRSMAASDGALAYVARQLTDRGFSNEEVAVQISNIPQILDFLSLAPRASHLGGLKFGSLIAATLETNSADIKSVGKPYNNEALRVFVFEGNLVASIEREIPDEKKIVLVPIGAAILFDMFNSIPNGQSLCNVLSEKDGTFSDEIKKMPVRFDRDETVSKDFRFAVASLEKRRDVLVLDLP